MALEERLRAYLTPILRDGSLESSRALSTSQSDQDVSNIVVDLNLAISLCKNGIFSDFEVFRVLETSLEPIWNVWGI